MKKKLKSLLFLIFLIAFNLIGGYISSSLSGDQKAISETLIKPWGYPPSFVFPIVWSILYTLLGVGAFLNYKKNGNELLIYFISMIINFSWSIVFFGQQLYGIGFFIIIILILLSIYLAIRYFKFSKIASFIMIIYIVWLTYAAYLNFFIWKYNEM